MNLFDVHALAYVLHQLWQAETNFLLLKIEGQGSQKPDGESRARIAPSKM
jgi:hypothetical protein